MDAGFFVVVAWAVLQSSGCNESVFERRWMLSTDPVVTQAQWPAKSY